MMALRYLHCTHLILGSSLGYAAACFGVGSSQQVRNMENIINCEKGKFLYDFRNISSVDKWKESSDTVRNPGMSKGSFVLQAEEAGKSAGTASGLFETGTVKPVKPENMKSRLFQRAVFFSLLNPQPNGAGFVGFYTYDDWNLEGFTGVRLRVRGQGENSVYKVMFKHKGHTIDDGSVSYQAFFQLPIGNWTTLTVPFSSFRAYHRGRIQPDAEPLDLRRISLVGLQIVGGVYSNFKQSGTSSLEIDFIRAV